MGMGMGKCPFAISYTVFIVVVASFLIRCMGFQQDMSRRRLGKRKKRWNLQPVTRPAVRRPFSILGLTGVFWLPHGVCTATSRSRVHEIEKTRAYSCERQSRSVYVFYACCGSALIRVSAELVVANRCGRLRARVKNRDYRNDGHWQSASCEGPKYFKLQGCPQR